jgi:GDPmannose 4,6-dehydratase
MYGDTDQIPTPETVPPLPMSGYGQSKFCAEQYLGLYSRVYGLSTVALRFGNVYGPRQDPHGEAGVIAIFCGKFAKGEAPTIFGDGKQTRDYIYVGDLVDAIVTAGDGDAEGAINIGTEEETTVLELVEAIGAAAAGRSRRASRRPASASWSAAAWPSAGRARSSGGRRASACARASRAPWPRSPAPLRDRAAGRSSPASPARTGSYLAELLLEQGHEVVGLVRPPADRDLGIAEHLRGDVRLVTADLAQPADVARVVGEVGADDVFHLAAPTFVPASWDDPAAALTAIAGATAAVLDAAREQGARVLTVASPEIFGDAGGVTPQDEHAPRRPRSPYGVAKLAAHELTRVQRDERGVHACSVITYNHESPRRPERFVTRKITRAAAAISLGRQDEVALGDLAAKRDWCHARDVVRGMALALAYDAPGDYVLASGTARTVGEFADAAFAAAGLRAADHVRVDPAFVRPPEPTLLVGDASHARAVLGWQPEIGFDALVAEMVEADLRDLRERG